MSRPTDRFDDARRRFLLHARRRVRLGDGRRTAGHPGVRRRRRQPPRHRVQPWFADRGASSRRRPSASSTCTCLAPCRRPTPSTTSRCSRRCTGRSFRRRCAAHSACRRWSQGRRRSRSSARSRSFSRAAQSGAMDQRPDAVHARRSPTTSAIIRTMNTEHVNHDPASKFLHTGFQIAGRPSGGAWVNYALGSNNQDLPTFVVMSSGNAKGVPDRRGGVGLRASCRRTTRACSSAPATTRCPYIGNPDGLTSKDRRDMLDAIGDVARACSTRMSNDPEILSKREPGRDVVPDADVGARRRRHLRTSRDHVLDLYGPDVRKPGTFARNCLLARRLAERDVRYIDGRTARAGIITTASPRLHAGVVRDCGSAVGRRWSPISKQRGLLEDTLVIFATRVRPHVVRTGRVEGQLRPRPPRRQLQRLAGRRRREGRDTCTARQTTSATTSSRIRSMSTTSMRPSCALLGIDHMKLTYRAQGRDFRLTDVAGKVVNAILA